MKAKQIAPGVYRDEQGRLWERPNLSGKRTWRRLYSLRITDAKQELATKRSDQKRAKLGLARNPYHKAPTVAAILEKWKTAGFPRPSGNARAPSTRRDSEGAIRRAGDYFGPIPADQLTTAHTHRYTTTKAATTACKDIAQIRTALRWAFHSGLTDHDTSQRLGAPLQRQPTQTHCRDRMPLSIDEVHDLAEQIARRPGGHAAAWQLVIECLTGCRTNEILKLRMDAGDKQPGKVDKGWLWLERSKGGVNPFALIHPALAECIAAHHEWHARRFPNSPWWIPWERVPQRPAPIQQLSRFLDKACTSLQLERRTPHGSRAFYVTVRRCQGIPDAQIAAEIGDRSGATLIASTYGSIPPSWQGGSSLSFSPKQPFWERSPVFSPPVPTKQPGEIVPAKPLLGHFQGKESVR